MAGTEGDDGCVLDTMKPYTAVCRAPRSSSSVRYRRVP